MALHRQTQRQARPASAFDRLAGLLRQRPMTITELAEALAVSPRTVRNYLTLLSRTQDIQVDFAYGASRYWIAADGV